MSYFPPLFIKHSTHRCHLTTKSPCQILKFPSVSRVVFVDRGVLLMYYNPGYLEVGQGMWTCVACMDRRARDWKSVLRHEKAEGHMHAVAIRLRKPEGSLPEVLGSTDVETTTPALQDLLLALEDEREETGEWGTPGVAESTDDEGGNEVLDVSALAASLLGQFDDDQGLDIHQASGLESEGHTCGLSCFHLLSGLFLPFVGAQEGQIVMILHHRNGYGYSRTKTWIYGSRGLTKL